MNRADRIAAGLLLAGVPLFYLPWTVELLPQKALVFALALAVGLRGSPFAAASLLVGVVVTAVRPAAPWEILALTGAPAAWGVLRRVGSDKVAATVRVVCWILCGLAGLQLAGLDPFGGSTRAFDLDYAVLTATLGNPNHLGAWLVLAAPFVTGPTLAALALTVVGTRSMLAIGALAVHLMLRAPWRWQRMALGGALLCGAAWAHEPLVNTAEGRIRLASEFSELIDARTLITGMGPGTMRAAYMAQRTGRLEDPRHPHNDFLRLVIVWGLPACLLLVLGLFFRLRGPPLSEAWLPAGLLALGATIVGDPAVWAMLLAHAARDFAPMKPSAKRTPAVGALAGALAAVALLWCVEGASQRRVLEAIAERDRPPAADLERVRDWPFDPVLSTWLTTGAGKGR